MPMIKPRIHEVDNRSFLITHGQRTVRLFFTDTQLHVITGSCPGSADAKGHFFSGVDKPAQLLAAIHHYKAPTINAALVAFADHLTSHQPRHCFDPLIAKEP